MPMDTLKVRTMQAICKIAGDNEVDRRMEATINTMEEMKARDAAAARLHRQVELLEKKKPTPSRNKSSK